MATVYMTNHKPITAVCLLHSNGAAYANQCIAIKLRRRSSELDAVLLYVIVTTWATP